VHNLTPETAKKVLDANSFSDIRQIKTEHPEILIIAAHPFHYGPSCLGKEALLHHELFDAWEYSFFHTSLFNPNRKTVKLAKKINKPLVGNSDVHFLKDLGRTYTLIDVDILTNDSKNSATSTTDYRARILQAIKEGKTEVVTNPIPLREFLTIAVKICKNMAVKFFLKKS
ncbi:hypothetical protein HYX12_00710, partial [Candidatus Woesearchaeota archaeon]|nr:hypothetical protein [Candidatus Woesearchaeota archaeon]